MKILLVLSIVIFFSSCSDVIEAFDGKAGDTTTGRWAEIFYKTTSTVNLEVFGSGQAAISCTDRKYLELTGDGREKFYLSDECETFFDTLAIEWDIPERETSGYEGGLDYWSVDLVCDEECKISKRPEE